MNRKNYKVWRLFDEIGDFLKDFFKIPSGNPGFEFSLDFLMALCGWLCFPSSNKLSLYL